jgi:hypothetical protein
MGLFADVEGIERQERFRSLYEISAGSQMYSMRMVTTLSKIMIILRKSTTSHNSRLYSS